MDRYPYHWYIILLGATRALVHIGVHFTHRVFGLSPHALRARPRVPRPSPRPAHAPAPAACLLHAPRSQRRLRLLRARAARQRPCRAPSCLARAVSWPSCALCRETACLMQTSGHNTLCVLRYIAQSASLPLLQYYPAYCNTNSHLTIHSSSLHPASFCNTITALQYKLSLHSIIWAVAQKGFCIIFFSLIIIIITNFFHLFPAV